MTGRAARQAGEGQRSLRADAHRNRERVLAAARDVFARTGFEASYHEIARAAGVGVGTVYRRYPDRAALLEAVLLDVLDGLSARAEAALAEPDGWAAFAGFFADLSDQVGRHAGLSGRLGDHGGERVIAARRRLLEAVDALCRRAREAGLRADVGLEDVLFLAQATAAEGCGLGLAADAGHRARALDVVLDGLRSASAAGGAGPS